MDHPPRGIRPWLDPASWRRVPTAPADAPEPSAVRRWIDTGPLTPPDAASPAWVTTADDMLWSALEAPRGTLDRARLERLRAACIALGDIDPAWPARHGLLREIDVRLALTDWCARPDTDPLRDLVLAAVTGEPAALPLDLTRKRPGEQLIRLIDREPRLAPDLTLAYADALVAWFERYGHDGARQRVLASKLSWALGFLLLVFGSATYRFG